MTLPLQNRRIALAEGRQVEELAQLLEREGSIPLRYPMLRILDVPDPGPVEEWLKELAEKRFGYVILMTGEGLRRLLGFAERAGRRGAVLAALANTSLVTRGPKPVQALKEIGLKPTLVASPPTTAGVIACLRKENLKGITIGVQLYGPENPELLGFLSEAGAHPRSVLPYVYAPGSDADQVTELINHLAEGEMDAVIFTSSPQVDRLFEVAAEKNLAARTLEGLTRTMVAAVGPVVADNLRRRGVKVAVCPEQGFVMKNLVQLLKRELGPKI